MITIATFVYVCVTFFLTGENHAALVLIPSLTIDAVLFHFLYRE